MLSVVSGKMAASPAPVQRTATAAPATLSVELNRRQPNRAAAAEISSARPPFIGASSTRDNHAPQEQRRPVRRHREERVFPG
jgi:hypothetical protein